MRLRVAQSVVPLKGSPRYLALSSCMGGHDLRGKRRTGMGPSVP